jgi:hypothetical protein
MKKDFQKQADYKPRPNIRPIVITTPDQLRLVMERLQYLARNPK